MIEISKPVVPAFAKFAERISVPFSPVVRAGDWVYVSGLAPINPESGG
jgi:enamine deaminase RidA (YjgF/YER057c/UK114 family)